jgi:hypothetical protein
MALNLTLRSEMSLAGSVCAEMSLAGSVCGQRHLGTDRPCQRLSDRKVEGRFGAEKAFIFWRRDVVPKVGRSCGSLPGRLVEVIQRVRDRTFLVGGAAPDDLHIKQAF